MVEKFDPMVRMKKSYIQDANIMAAITVNQKAEMGWFDTEFTMYGCAYLVPNEGKMYFKVSEKAKDIYDFVYYAPLKDIYPSNVLRATCQCAVPAGSKESIAQHIKYRLAIELKNHYPHQFFEKLYTFAECFRDDALTPLLWEKAERLEGGFDREKIYEFVELVKFAYSSLRIKRESYLKLIEWAQEEQKNMNDDVVNKDIFEKTMYSIAYKEQDHIKYMEDALKEAIYEEMYNLEQKGNFITPIFEKRYWYNYEYRLPDVIRDFKNLTRQRFDEQYLDMIASIKKRVKIKPEEEKEFNRFLINLQKENDRGCSETLRRYGYHWGVL